MIRRPAPAARRPRARTASFARARPSGGPLPLALVAALALAPPAAAQDDVALPEGVAATVDGRPISERAVEEVLRRVEGEGATRERVVDELVDLEILAAEAEKLGLDERPDIAATLRLQYLRTMTDAWLAAEGETMSFDEEELRAEYERRTADVERAEFRVRHILLGSEAEAEAVIGELADGADFAALVGERSIEPGDGDLGWLSEETVGPDFARAVAALEVGESGERPVRTDFGYHVIRLEERRELPLPAFDAVRPQLSDVLLRERLGERVERLRESADVRRR